MVPPLQSLGIQDEVVCLDEPTELADPFPIHQIGRGRGPWRYSSKLRPWLDENLDRFDAVIVHALWLYHSSAVAKTIAQRRRVGAHCPKLLVMPHGMLDPWFQRAPSRRLKAARNWAYWKCIESRVVSEADAMLFTCQRELELAREPFRPYHPKLEVNAGYGVAEPPANASDLKQHFWAQLPELDQRPFLLYLSRIHPKKGIENLLRAYGSLKQNDSSSEIPALVIAGPLDSDYADRMQSLAKQLGVFGSSETNDQPAVYFAGMLQGESKWGAFYACDAFVLPSHQENFGIAVVEALACGKPVMISDQINIYKEIEHAGAALIEPDTLEGTRRLLTEWIERSDEDRQTMSLAAATCYQMHFRPESAAKRLVETISGLN